MASGMEMAVMTMAQKLMSNLPPEIAGQIGQIGQIALGLKGQLDRIENQNRLIIAHLKIPAETETKEVENGRSEIE